jgi:hypothetical protein
MKVCTISTAACAALAFVVAGTVLAPDGQAETLTPKSDQTIPNAVDEVSGASST